MKQKSQTEFYFGNDWIAWLDHQFGIQFPLTLRRRVPTIPNSMQIACVTNRAMAAICYRSARLSRAERCAAA
jgi:hypothetical protein